MSEPASSPPLRVEVTRSGGFAGLVRHAVRDAAELPPAQADQLRRLAESAESCAPTQPAPSGGADRFSYDVAISRGSEHSTYSYSEAALPAPVRELVDLVLSDAGRSGQA